MFAIARASDTNGRTVTESFFSPACSLAPCLVTHELPPFVDPARLGGVGISPAKISIKKLWWEPRYGGADGLTDRRNTLPLKFVANLAEKGAVGKLRAKLLTAAAAGLELTGEG